MLKPGILNIKVFNFLHSKINEVNQQYKLNERINDWFDKHDKDYFSIKNDFGYISIALRESLLLTAAKLLDNRDTNSLTIQKICNIINSCKITNDSKVLDSVKLISNEILSRIGSSIILKDLFLWRDKYLAHYDKFIKNNIIELKNIEVLMDLLIYIFNRMSEISLMLFNIKPTLTYEICGDSIDDLFLNYSLGIKFANTIPPNEYKNLFLNIIP